MGWGGGSCYIFYDKQYMENEVRIEKRSALSELVHVMNVMNMRVRAF